MIMKNLVKTDFDKTYDELSNLSFIINEKEDSSIDILDDITLEQFGQPYEKSSIQSLKIKNTCGIYLIFRKAEDGRLHKYIGQATSLRDRLLKHLSRAAYIMEHPKTDENKNLGIYKDSPALHSALIRHNFKGFFFVILKICKQEQLNALEQFAIAQYGTFENKWDYNLTPGGQEGVITHTTAVEQWIIEYKKSTKGHAAEVRWINCKNVYPSEAAASIAVCGENKHQQIANALATPDGEFWQNKSGKNKQWAGYGWRLLDEVASE